MRRPARLPQAHFESRHLQSVSHSNIANHKANRSFSTATPQTHKLDLSINKTNDFTGAKFTYATSRIRKATIVLVWNSQTMLFKWEKQ